MGTPQPVSRPQGIWHGETWKYNWSFIYSHLLWLWTFFEGSIFLWPKVHAPPYASKHRTGRRSFVSGDTCEYISLLTSSRLGQRQLHRNNHRLDRFGRAQIRASIDVASAVEVIMKWNGGHGNNRKVEGSTGGTTLKKEKVS